MRYRADIADPVLAMKLQEALSGNLEQTIVSMPILFVDEVRLQTRQPEFGEAIVLVLHKPPTRAHTPLLWAGLIHDIIDASVINTNRVLSACLKADAVARLVNDALAMRTLEREHFMNTAMPLLRSSVDGERFVAANPAMLKLLGYSSEHELLALNPKTDLYVTGNLRESGFDELQENGAMAPSMFSVKKKNGELLRVLHQGALVIDHLDQPIYIEGSFIDVTEVEEIKRQLDELNQDLLTAHRQAGMAEIASGILHNVGNALNSVKVSVELLEDQIREGRNDAALGQVGKKLLELRGASEKDNATLAKLADFCESVSDLVVQGKDTLKKELGVVKHGLEHVSQVVSRQQRYARQGGTAEPIELNELLRDALALNITESHINVETNLSEGPPVMTDKHLLLQIIGNLLRNAVHATQKMDDREPLIEVELTHRLGHASISVRDNGVGISPSAQEHLFNYGFTTKSAGHGIGLHSSAIAIQQMGGELRFHSDGEGCGAEFTITLPQAESVSKTSAIA